MALLNDLYRWTNFVLVIGEILVFIWAVVDCATRKNAAFAAVNKLTKAAWLAILVVGGGLGSLVAYDLSPLNFISLITLVAALVYLCDVRPAVREISGGR